MAEIVITEFMDAAPVERLKERYAVHWDEQLADKRSELLGMLNEATAIIVRNRTQVDEELLSQARNLKVVGRLGVGLDNIDMTACESAGVTVCPAIGANAPSVAEYVIGAALVLVRGVYAASAQMASDEWPRQVLSGGGELGGRTMGLIGFGSIGQEVARRAAALGMKTIAFDPVLPDDDKAWSIAEKNDFSDVLRRADVISLHVPLTDHTRNMIGKDELARMKASTILINTARGGIVDETDLVSALRCGSIGGAALDVFENEPPDGSHMKLLEGLSNVILTPHIAGLTAEANVRVSEMTVDNVLRVLSEKS